MNMMQDGGVLLDSWRRCEKAGVPQEPTERLYPVGGARLEALCREHQAVLAAFAGAVDAGRTPRGAAFLLTDPQGLLLKKNPGQEGASRHTPRAFLR